MRLAGYILIHLSLKAICLLIFTHMLGTIDHIVLEWTGNAHMLVIERAKRAHSLFRRFPIYIIYVGIYVRVVRVSCVCFLRILRKLYGTRMGTIKIKWRKVS